jgi:hypothetical protein
MVEAVMSRQVGVLARRYSRPKNNSLTPLACPRSNTQSIAQSIASVFWSDPREFT